MFRSSTVIRELNLTKVIFMLKHLLKLSRYLLCGCVAACHGMVCVLYAVQNATESHSAQHTTHTHTCISISERLSNYGIIL